MTLSPISLTALLQAFLLQGPSPEPVLSLRDTAVLTSPRLRESSGVAASRRAGVYWTHNDSGDEPRVYATDSLGRDLGFVRLVGARNVDWEDLAAGPCETGSARCLYVGDIGDNGRDRRYVVVYRIREPEPPLSPDDTLRAEPADSLVLTYPGGPRNAEGLAVTPDGWLLIVTKDWVGSPLLMRARIDGPPAQLMDSVSRLPISVSALEGRLVTGADVSADGSWLVVRTYVSLHLFRLGQDGVPTPVTAPRGLSIPVVESQGEGVAFEPHGGLVLTSERGGRGHAILSRLRLSLPAP